MEALQLRLTEFKKALNAAQEHEKKSLAAYNDAIDQFTQDPSNPEAARLQKNTSDAYTLAMTARAGAAQRVIEQQDLIAKSLAATNKDLLQSEKKHQTTVDKLRTERDQATTRAEAAARAEEAARAAAQHTPATDGAGAATGGSGETTGTRSKNTIKNEQQPSVNNPMIQPGPVGPAAPLPAHPVQGGQLATIPSFSGVMPYDVEGWIAMVERAQAQFNWSDSQTCAVVKNKLTDLATTWLRAQEKLNKPGFYTWLAGYPVSFKKIFETKYLPHKTEQAAILAVSHLQQKPTEKVSDFFDRVVLAVDKVNHHTTVEEKRTENYQRMFATQVQTFFAAGMKQEIRQVVLGSNSPPTTMETLRDQAIATETQISNKPMTVKELVEVTEDKPEGSTETQMKDIVKQLEVLSTQQKKLMNRSSTRGRAPRDLSKVTCYRCGNKGHYSPQCQMDQRGNTQGRGGRGGYRGGRGGQQFPRGGYNNQQRKTTNEVTTDETYNQGN